MKLPNLKPCEKDYPCTMYGDGRGYCRSCAFNSAIIEVRELNKEVFELGSLDRGIKRVEWMLEKAVNNHVRDSLERLRQILVVMK